jgi:hypothetical protein
LVFLACHFGDWTHLLVANIGEPLIPKDMG